MSPKYHIAILISLYTAQLAQKYENLTHFLQTHVNFYCMYSHVKLSIITKFVMCRCIVMFIILVTVYYYTCVVTELQSGSYLGVIIDQDLSLKEQVNAIWRSCYGHRRSIIQIKPYLTKSAAHTTVQSLISSRLDYCNSLLAELPQYFIHRLQKVQNWATRIVLNVEKHDSIWVHLHQLHWLPVRFWIKFKINLLVYKSLNQ